MKRLFLSIALVLSIGLAQAQSAADSLTIVSAKWQSIADADGINSRQAHFLDLYGGAQCVSIIEISPAAKCKVGVAADLKMSPTSAQAEAHNAVAAINGSFYNMREGNSVCFYKIDKQVIANTSPSELSQRVNGAIVTKKGKLQIIDWSESIEQNYKGQKGTVLASGPLMLDQGEVVSWEKCGQKFINDKHPRSAIYIKADGTVGLITVDGRSRDNAIGVSIPELAHLVKVLGGEEALNLDGGGSTTLWLKSAPENGIINYPCDNRKFDHKGERRVANIIYLSK